LSSRRNALDQGRREGEAEASRLVSREWSRGDLGAYDLIVGERQDVLRAVDRKLFQKKNNLTPAF